MCDGSEYTVFYLKETSTSIEGNHSGHIFEPEIMKDAKPNNIMNTLLFKLFNLNNNSNKNNWDV